MRGEMPERNPRLRSSSKTTFIQKYATSQEEALAEEARSVVMNRGRIEQLWGRRKDIFDRPATRFVAAFMGMSNCSTGKVSASTDRSVAVDCGGHTVYGDGRERARPLWAEPGLRGGYI